MTKQKVCDILEKLFREGKIHDFAMDDMGNMENYYVKTTADEWLSYDAWLEKNQKETNG